MAIYFRKGLFTDQSRLATLLLMLIYLNGCSQASLSNTAQSITEKSSTNSQQIESGLADVTEKSESATLHPAFSKRFSIKGSNLAIKDILILMVQNSDISLEIHPSVQGKLSVQIEQQSMLQILQRICQQANLIYRFDAESNLLVVSPDIPFLQHYRIDYVNIERDTKGGISVTNQLASAQTGIKTNTPAGSTTQQNNSSTTVNTLSNHHFWKSLIKNIEELLEETDKQTLLRRLEFDARLQAEFEIDLKQSKKPNMEELIDNSPPQQNSEVIGKKDTRDEFAGHEKKLKSYRTLFASKMIANKETGIISIRTTQQQHQKIQEFLNMVLDSANRQVLIEAAIVEVTLSDEYQAGVDWTRLAASGKEKGWTFSQKLLGNNLAIAPLSSIAFKQSTKLGDLSGTLKLLQTFGKTKVLSSPKLMVMNNQTAVLKVVDNLVYFTINADTTSGNANSPAITTVTTTPFSIPVGIWMSVTPQINQHQDIILNIRPTIARQLGNGIQDPNPNIKIESRIPQIQVREMESILKVEDGSTVILGGLMQEELVSKQQGVPGLMALPWLGKLFQYEQQQLAKTELVILLKPVVARSPNLATSYNNFWQDSHATVGDQP